MAERILVSVDNSQQSNAALTWALENACSNGQELHIISVVDDKNYYGRGAQQRLDEQSAGSEVLTKAIQRAAAAGVPDNLIHAYEIPAEGDVSGADGTAAAIVNYANSKKICLTVLGSRGLGAIRRRMMSLVGIGSVSELVAQTIHTPLIIIKPYQYAGLLVDASGDRVPGTTRRIAIAIEDAVESQLTLEWALQHFVRPTDHLHLISHAKPQHTVSRPEVVRPKNSSLDLGPPRPASQHPAPSEASGPGDASVGLAMQHGKDGSETAEKVLAAATRFATANGVPETAVHSHMIPPHATPDRVTGHVLVLAVAEIKADVLVMGSRGSGSSMNGESSLEGLGSSVNYCIHHAPCPVLVNKTGKATSKADIPTPLGSVVSSDMSDMLDYGPSKEGGAKKKGWFMSLGMKQYLDTGDGPSQTSAVGRTMA